jgi:hypothetical protein
MKRAESNGSIQKMPMSSRTQWLNRLLCGWALAFSIEAATAAPALNTACPIDFFTNAAQALFANLNLQDANANLICVTNIPVYPTNYYTPAVHRILQLAANTYDATVAPSNGAVLYPTIFRPYFSGSTNSVVISGYELVNGPYDTNTDPGFLTVPVDFNDATARASVGTQTRMNAYGAPWIIGTRKGFPNFNAVLMQNVSQMTRRLQFTRSGVPPADDQNPYTDFNYQCRQMLVMGVSNVVAVEVWNSYSNSYPRPVYIQADAALLMALTNDAPPGFQLSTNILIGGTTIGLGATNIPSGNQWPGTGLTPGIPASANAQSFIVPLLTNVVLLPDSGFQFSPPAFIPLPTNAAVVWTSIPAGSFPMLNWGLIITNRLRCLVMDGGLSGRVVDYVQLNGLNAYRNLSGETYTNGTSGDLTTMWSTNLGSIPVFPTNVPVAIISQIDISEAQPPVSDTAWANGGTDQSRGTTREQVIDSFRVFMALTPMYFPTTVNTQLVMQAPFSPTSKRIQPLFWQANDPLVHYTAGDLGNPLVTNSLPWFPPNNPLPPLTTNLYRFSDRFDPWGGNPQKTGGTLQGANAIRDTNAFNWAVKDPMVRTSDDWDFPTNGFPDTGWLGRIHRGTPWQTIYLKSPGVDINSWQNWTGDPNAADATLTMPTNDWRLARLLVSLLSTNDPRQLFSVNNPDTNAWLGLLDGMPVLTNSLSVSQSTTVIMTSNSPQAALIVAGIQRTRSAQSGCFFHNVGDILATPELSSASPWLNTNSATTLSAGGLTDEACEAIPVQLLPLLREDSVGSATSTNNQLLVQFTGYDNYAYAVEASSNFVNWAFVSTNYPTNGVFSVPTAAPANSGPQFYRSVLLP